MKKTSIVILVLTVLVLIPFAEATAQDYGENGNAAFFNTATRLWIYYVKTGELLDDRNEADIQKIGSVPRDEVLAVQGELLKENGIDINDGQAIAVFYTSIMVLDRLVKKEGFGLTDAKIEIAQNTGFNLAKIPDVDSRTWEYRKSFVSACYVKIANTLQALERRKTGNQ